MGIHLADTTPSIWMDVVNRSVYIHEIMIMSQKENMLDRLKINPRSATKEAPTCAPTSSLWRGVGEVSSAGEVG